jgi:hypothetical protein
LYGLSLYKPSTLWPPPSDELTQRVQSSLKSRIRHLARLDASGPGPVPTVHDTRFKGGIIPSKHDSGAAGKGLEDTVHASDGNRGKHAPSLPRGQDHVDVGATAPLPTATAASSPHATSTSIPSSGPGSGPHVVRITAKDGSELSIESQIQLYVPNDLVTHPLVSPALSYLGGLPPMLFIEGDKEVLRDEGIFA